MKPELSLSPRGLSLFADSRAHLFSTPDWLELAIKDEASKTVKFKKAGTTLVGKTKQLSVSASIKSKKGQVTPHITVTLKIANLTKNPVAFNAKWRLPLADQNSPTRWLIPALFYKDNAQQFPGGPPALWPKEDLKENRSPWWLFRSDLMAVPMAMGWAGGVSTAI
ncbi:MAG: hypothetical protein SGI71_10155, partial [Verrucomicrobiota bacterium]|nr:hypothetical protein [Verrucomicrobiota bacterium]